MSNTICPYCKHNAAPENLAKGAAKGAGVAAVSMIPGVGLILGAALGTKIAYDLWKKAGKQIITCSNCGEDYGAS